MPNGNMASTFEEVAKFVVTHFSQLFSAPNMENITKIIHIVEFFQRMVDQEAKDDLNVEFVKF